MSWHTSEESSDLRTSQRSIERTEIEIKIEQKVSYCAIQLFFLLPFEYGFTLCVFLLLSVNESSVWRFFHFVSWILIHWTIENVFCRCFSRLFFFCPSCEPLPTFILVCGSPSTISLPHRARWSISELARCSSDKEGEKILFNNWRV